MNKRTLIAVGLLIAGAAAIFALHRKQATTEITPRPLLYLLADTEREAERIPLALTRVSDQEENKIGDDLAKQQNLDRSAGQDAEALRIQSYITEVGMQLAQHVHRPAIHYHFHFIPQDSFVNAYAMPGGHIVVGRGILRLMESEDELAAVLGHEITHVDNRHSVERLQYELRARKIGLEALYRLGAIGVQLFEAGYSKDQELEADRVGLGFAVDSGYSPAGAIAIMEHFAKLDPRTPRPAQTPIGELAGVPIEALQEYFRSHPPEDERIAELKKEIASQGWDENKPTRAYALRPIFLTAEARALDLRGQFPRAIGTYHQAIQLDKYYAPALQGLATALWRSGDVSGASVAAEEALAVDPRSEATWLLLARALAVAEPSGAHARFVRDFNGAHIDDAAMGKRLRVTENALRIVSGENFDAAMSQFKSLIQQADNDQMEAVMHWRMGRWLYRTGKLQLAFEELLGARQMTPQNPAIDLDLGYVMMDLKKLADAEDAVHRACQGNLAPSDCAALQALFYWRTDRRDPAAMAFQRAAEADPVWLQPRWASQNFSPAAAGTFGDLRMAELARRKKEAEERAKAEAARH
jgi:predicted Zn-dependent protease